MTTEDYKVLLPSLPDEPGVYRYLDAEDTIIYVGKAKNLKKRIASYFGEKRHQMYRTRVMIKNATHIEYTVVETETDALLLENTLIKKFQPRYNVMLKDGKSYTYLCIKKERFPRVFFTRRVIKDGSTYFGPYTSKYRTKVLFEIIKTIFPLRTCNYNLSKPNIEKRKFKVCLEYHIGNCKGPCEGNESEEDYNHKIEQVKNILKGNFKPVKDFIYSSMQMHVEKLEFEKAEVLKGKLFAFEDYQAKSLVVNPKIKDVDVFHINNEDEKRAYINYLKIVNGALINTDTIELEKNLDTEEGKLLSYGIMRLREKFNSIAKEIVVPIQIKIPEKEIDIQIPRIGDKKKLLDLAQKNLKYFLIQRRKENLSLIKKQTPIERILKTMQSDLQMDTLPYHMECFDNSNIQGTNPVASCVVFKNTKPSKKDYRHYNIKTVVGPDDFASMEEVVKRRYTRLIKEQKPLPNLVVIDGGKGQLGAAVKIFRDLGILKKVTLIGIAKRLEEIYFPGDPIPLYINKKSETLKLIQQIRNEAHRFAITFHRNQRSKNFIGSELNDIPGIGKKSTEKLLSHFKSVKSIKRAEEATIASIIGRSGAKKVFNYFHVIEEGASEKNKYL